MRAQNLRNARQPAGVHRRVLAAGRVSCVVSGYEDTKYLLTGNKTLREMIELFYVCQK